MLRRYGARAAAAEAPLLMHSDSRSNMPGHSDAPAKREMRGYEHERIFRAEELFAAGSADERASLAAHFLSVFSRIFFIR